MLEVVRRVSVVPPGEEVVFDLRAAPEVEFTVEEGSSVVVVF